MYFKYFYIIYQYIMIYYDILSTSHNYSLRYSVTVGKPPAEHIVHQSVRLIGWNGSILQRIQCGCWDTPMISGDAHHAVFVLVDWWSFQGNDLSQVDEVDVYGV